MQIIATLIKDPQSYQGLIRLRDITEFSPLFSEVVVLRKGVAIAKNYTHGWTCWVTLTSMACKVQWNFQGSGGALMKRKTQGFCIYSIWVFPKIGVGPPNHPFVHRVFHYFHHPFGGFPHYFWRATHITTYVLVSNKSKTLWRWKLFSEHVVISPPLESLSQVYEHGKWIYIYIWYMYLGKLL